MSTAKTDDVSLDIYKEICANIRATDDISFKLLGFVPVSSGIGAGALVLLEKSKLLEVYTGPASPYSHSSGPSSATVYSVGNYGTFSGAYGLSPAPPTSRLGC